MEAVKTVVAVFNSLTPLGLCGMLGYIIYLIVAKKGPIQTISNNHLSGLPDMAATLERMEETLGEIRDGINYLRGRLNGR